MKTPLNYYNLPYLYYIYKMSTMSTENIEETYNINFYIIGKMGCTWLTVDKMKFDRYIYS